MPDDGMDDGMDETEQMMPQSPGGTIGPRYTTLQDGPNTNHPQPQVDWAAIPREAFVGHQPMGQPGILNRSVVDQPVSQAAPEGRGPRTDGEPPPKGRLRRPVGRPRKYPLNQTREMTDPKMVGSSQNREAPPKRVPMVCQTLAPCTDRRKGSVLVGYAGGAGEPAAPVLSRDLGASYRPLLERLTNPLTLRRFRVSWTEAGLPPFNRMPRETIDKFEAGLLEAWRDGDLVAATLENLQAMYPNTMGLDQTTRVVAFLTGVNAWNRLHQL